MTTKYELKRANNEWTLPALSIKGEKECKYSSTTIDTKKGKLYSI